MTLHRIDISGSKAIVSLVAMLALCSTVHAQRVVPGSGQRLSQAGDDFEDPNWSFTYNLPKSSNNLDGQTRLPAGTAKNGRFFEPALRGQPDLVERVETPLGGLPGSTGALAIATRESGVPGRATRTNQQDDLVARMGGAIPVSRSPSVVVRVYLPPFEEWETRTGNSFGIRTSCYGRRSPNAPRPRGSSTSGAYWPGFFIHLYSSKTDKRYPEDFAMLLIRANDRGADVFGPRITEPGWWTMGMSFSPDGQVHYYAKSGVGNLTQRDYITSHFCYGFRCQRLDSFFFDVVSPDDGKTWSTKWIIDDPAVYVLR